VPTPSILPISTLDAALNKALEAFMLLQPLYEVEPLLWLDTRVALEKYIQGIRKQISLLEEAGK